jgi:4-alpha-glucanotransferase
MPSDTYEKLLDQAAADSGIYPGFWDIFGHYHTTSPEVKRAILKAMGLAVHSEEALAESLAWRTRERWQRLLPPAVVAGQTEVRLPVHAPAEEVGELLHLTIRREDGNISEHQVRLGEHPQPEAASVEGRNLVLKQACLDVALPLGYHEITGRLAGASATTRYIVTPERAFTPESLSGGQRTAGFAVSLYGIRSERNWGVGDFTDLLALTDWAADDLGVSFVALNPLHAIHNRRPFNTSPYLPNCIFYQNFLYLDVEAIEDFGACRRAREGRAAPAAVREIEELRRTPFVEYERVAALKLRFLKLAFARFLRERRGGSERARAFETFLEREGAPLEGFAVYCALDEYLHARNPDMWIWPQWPEAFRDPESPETRAFARKHWRSVLFYQYLQWQIDLQLGAAQQHARDRRMGIGLYHDLALATDKFGSDLWAHRQFYIEGCRVGSPPDDFSPHGQDWGFPPPNSERHYQDGYRLFAESIRQNCRQGGALRIDHVMRLFRLYWIPDALDAGHGSYVRERAEDMVRVLALESVRNRVLVVGEDLGTVEPEIRETLERFGILSYRLFYFEKERTGAFRPAAAYPRQALVSSTTHDLATLAGFWTGADIRIRREAGVIGEADERTQLEQRLREKQAMLDVLFAEQLAAPHLSRNAADYPELSGELHYAAIGFLASTPAQLWAINQEDLTKEPAQQNLPGSTWQYPNWGRKMRFTLNELRSVPEARDYTNMVRDWIRKAGRDLRA